MKHTLHLVILIIGLIAIGQTHRPLELRVPPRSPIGNIVNRLTNTTFGIFRGGINIFSRTIDRVVNTFNRVEDRLMLLLEEIRKQLVRGIPEFSIPILDPLHVDKVEFDVCHEAAIIKGTAEDFTVKHIAKFVADHEQLSDLGNLRFKLDLNLTFPYIRIDGNYTLDGIIGDMFLVYGGGKFWMNVFDLKLALNAIIKFEYPLKLIALNIDVSLGKLRNNFEHMMNDPEVGILFNKAISKMAPEALDILWPDIKGPVQDEIQSYVNQILENATVANLVRRLFNIK